LKGSSRRPVINVETGGRNSRPPANYFKRDITSNGDASSGGASGGDASPNGGGANPSDVGANPNAAYPSPGDGRVRDPSALPPV
jgi:hypothetical protein